MTMKKIMAGVLAAASVMAMSATAFAVEAPDKTKAISKPGTAEYEAGIGFLTAELDVELPGNMKAFLNPYGASVAVTEETTPTKLNSSIVSWAYEVVNNTEDFAIAIDVVDAVATPSKDVSIAASIAANETDKKAVVVLKSDADPSKLAYDSTKDIANKAGCVLFTTTKATQKKFASVPAKVDNEAGKTYIGITGDLTSVDEVDWTEDDSITCTYTLKINPSAAGAAARITGATATSNGAAVAAANIVVNATAKTVTITSGATAGQTVAVTLTTGTNTLGTVTATDATKFSGPANTSGTISGTFIAAGGGFTVLVNNGTDDETWTVVIN